MVAVGQVVPDQHHRDAARQAHQDESHGVSGKVSQQQHGEQEHDHRPDDPVLEERQGEDPLVPQNDPELLVAHLGQRRVHHEDEADGDGDRRGPDLRGLVQRLHGLRPQVADGHPDGHGGEDPDGQVAIEK